MDAVHSGTFAIARETLQSEAISAGPLSECCLDLIQGLASVEAWFPLAQQIEVGAVKQQQVHGPTLKHWLIVSTALLVMSGGVVRVGARVVNGGGL